MFVKMIVVDGVLAQHAEVTRCERPAIYHCLIQNSEQNIFCEFEDSFHPHPTISPWAREYFVGDGVYTKHTVGDGVPDVPSRTK